MTLTTLLKIVFGIGIPVLLYPVLVPARPLQCHPRICLSGVKQLALAAMIYASDHEDRFPPRTRWIEATLPLVKSDWLYHCPQAPGKWGYAFNADLDRRKTPVRPESAPLIYDSANLLHNASDRFASLPEEPRHKTGNNVSYADGHARRVRSRAP